MWLAFITRSSRAERMTRASCAFFLQSPPSRCWCARGRETTAGRRRAGPPPPPCRRARVHTCRGFPAAIATACSAWSTIFSTTWRSSAASHRDLIVRTASTGRDTRRTFAHTYAVYIPATGSTWWTYARLRSRNSLERSSSSSRTSFGVHLYTSDRSPLVVDDWCYILVLYAFILQKYYTSYIATVCALSLGRLYCAKIEKLSSAVHHVSNISCYVSLG